MRCQVILQLVALVGFGFLFGESVGDEKGKRNPNIIVILVDDVGLNDVSFETRKSSMPTPEIAKMCKEGVVMENFYTQSTCTPSRASLMTGRYAANTGLTFAMLPGAIAGLPRDMMTLPKFLREEANYEAHMVGKWHVGNSQWAQTPVGNGKFQTHVGSLLWSMEYNTKQIWEMPWEPAMLVDWIRADENGTYSHYQEERHSTEALTEEAIEVIKRHAGRFPSEADKPLFLYLAYTAAHAPLVPLPADEEKCKHYSHPWRRSFCGLMVGLDRGIGKVKEVALEHLGDDTIIVFSSDNGPALWFGGLSAPLRAGKTTPFEGGVKVPACIVDFSGKHFGKHQGEIFDGMMHLCDVFPTLAAAAGIEGRKVKSLKLDGLNMGPSLSGKASHPRESVLLEMYYGSKGEFMFDEDTVAFRKGKYKLIESNAHRDTLWYFETSNEHLNNTDDSKLFGFLPLTITRFGESLIKYLESFSGPGPFDTIKDLLVHMLIHQMFRKATTVEETLLFDLEKDPEERTNIAGQFPQVVTQLRKEIAVIRDNRPKQQQFWMTIDRDKEMDKILEKGTNCTQIQHESECVFIHPWIPDDANLDAVPLVDGTAAWPFIRSLLQFVVPYVGLALAVVLITLRIFNTFSKF